MIQWLSYLLIKKTRRRSKLLKKEIHKKLLDQLAFCSESTTKLCLRIDEHFTPLAKTLSALHESFVHHQNIIDEMSQLIGLTSFDEIKNALEEVTADNIDYNKTEINISKMTQGFHRNLGIIDKSLESYLAIAKMLKVIKVNMDIKNAKIRDRNFDLSDLLEDIETLAKDIINNASIIRATSDIVKNLLQNNITTTKNDTNSLYKEIQVIISNIEQISTDKKQNILNMKNDLKETIKDITDVIVSFQYADIIKQRFEHVAETINDLLKRLKHGSDDDTLRLAYEESQLQLLQVNNIYEQIDNTHQLLTKSLKHIHKVKEQLYNAAEIDNVSDENNITIQMEALLQGANKIVNFSKGIIEEEKGTSTKATNIYNQIDKIKARLSEITKIGNITQVVALNSQFKVQKLNNEGKGLYELSRIILGEAEKMKKTTVTLSSSIQEIITLAEELKELNQGKIESQVTAEEELLENITGFHDIIEGQEKHYKKKMKELNSSTIEDDMTYFIIILNKNELITNEVTDTVVSLKEIIKIIDEEKKFSLDPEESKKIEEIRNQYTMEHERDIHRRFLQDKEQLKTDGEDLQNDDDNIELF